MFVYVVFWLVDGSTRYRTASETSVWFLSSLMIGIQMMLEETVSVERNVSGNQTWK